jgi:hypothetical protein
VCRIVEDIPNNIIFVASVPPVIYPDIVEKIYELISIYVGIVIPDIDKPLNIKPFEIS